MTAISSSFSTTGLTLTTEDTLTLAAEAYLIATDGFALTLDGTNQFYDVTISGLLESRTNTAYSALNLVGDNNLAAITISETGVVRGDTGVYIGGAADITNHGSIVAVSNAGIHFAGSGYIGIANTGLIASGGTGFALLFAGSAVGEHAIDNSGIIKSSAVAIDGNLDAVEIVTNTGVIYGEVNLDGGDDVVHNEQGIISGVVRLEDGNDEFYGGLTSVTVNGGAGIDMIVGGIGDDIIDGGAGDSAKVIGQTLDGGAGNDIITGGADFDQLYGGIGDDTLIGGGGNDDYFVDSQGDVIVEAASATRDYVITTVSYTLGAQAHIELLAADNSDSTEPLALIGNALLGQRIRGNAGNNILNGGNDLFVDVLAGAGGNDTYVLGKQTFDLVSDTSGNDTITSTDDRSLADFGNIENLVLLGNIACAGTGNGKANVITGNGKNNALAGGGGADKLTGGLGRDIMTGGSGSDIFDFNQIADSKTTAGSRDVIKDFGRGADRIDLSTIDAIGGGGDDAFGLIARGSASSVVGTGKIGYFQDDNAGTSHDRTILRLNTDGDKGIEITIEISGLHTLHGSDFLL